MKHLALLTASLMIIFASCAQRDNFVVVQEKSDSIIVSGVWSWVSTDGGIANTHQTPASTGNERFLHLTSDHHYEFYTNTTVTEQGTYAIANIKSIIDNTTKPALTFSNRQTDQIIEILHKDTLKLADNAYDGFETLYLRQ